MQCVPVQQFNATALADFPNGREPWWVGAYLRSRGGLKGYSIQAPMAINCLFSDLWASLGDRLTRIGGRKGTFPLWFNVW